MGGARYAPDVSPSESDESFVSSASRREVHQPATSTSSTSPSRNGRVNGRKQNPPPTSPPTASYFTSHPGATPVHEPRSPIQRRPRPPASRSSHGIETLSGPPPALSTQRSYNNPDSPWRSQPTTDSATTPKPLSNRPGTEDSINSILQNSASNTQDRRYSEPGRAKDGPHSLSTTDKRSVAGMTYHNHGHSLEEDQDRTVRINGQELAMRRYTTSGNGEQHGQASPEDLFLDLAREDSVVDDTSEIMSRTERRRSRLGGQSRISHAPSSSARPSTSGAQFPSYNAVSSSQNQGAGSLAFEKTTPIDSLTALRSDLTRHRPYAVSAHPLEGLSRTPQRLIAEKTSFSSPMQYYSPESQKAIGRRRSIQAASTGSTLNSAERSHLPRRSRYASPPYADPSRRDEGTESTVSTRAASTVWDELDDMKSRIRQLELTGKLPSSSNAAISNALGDRPPTSGTTMTTLSSSPKRLQRQSVSPEDSMIRKSDVTGIHPLLHSALKRANETVSPEIYRTLEATAADALTVAALVGDELPPENGIERQVRRKADSVCRSLTELCIALAEEKSDVQSPGLRLLPGSKEGTPLGAHHDETARDSRLLRGVSEDPELRASSRVMSRLESRRTSLLASGTGQASRELSQEPATTPTQPATTAVSKLDRTNSVLRRRERDEESKTLRAPSRATTDVGQMRPSPQSRLSREYVSNHPLPKLPQRSPSVQPSLSTRKGFFHSTASSPLTPKSVLPGAKRYLPGSNPPSSTDSTRVAEARQRRLASLGQSKPASQPLTGRIRHNESET